MGEAGLTQGQGSHSHDQWRGRWERQAGFTQGQGNASHGQLRGR